jgi:DNA anti-recombination protein RmuC
VSRFDIKQSGGHDLSSSLEAAAAELRASLERQVREIVAAAEERASQIEQEAAHRAELIDRESERRFHESLQGALGRAWAILGGIEDLEARVTEVTGALRGEMEALIADLESRAPSDPVQVPGDRQSELPLRG